MPPLRIDFEASQYGMPFFNDAMHHSQACNFTALSKVFGMFRSVLVTGVSVRLS